MATGSPSQPGCRTTHPGASPTSTGRSRKEIAGAIDIHRRRHFVPSRPSAVKRGLYELTFFANGIAARGLPDADCAIGVTPSLSGALLAASWAKRRNRPYGLIVQDLMGLAAAQSGTPGGNRVADLTAKLESVAVRNATAIGVIADGFRPHLHTMGADRGRIHRIRNWTHIQPSNLEKSAARAQLGLPQHAFIALHAGNMGLKQGLENVVAAAKHAAQHPDPIHFVFLGDGNQRHVLEHLATGLPNVRFIPPLPDADFPSALAAADALLVAQRPTITDMCLPSKLTSYLAANRPVVAAVAPDSETARELTAAQCGLVVPYGDPLLLLDAFESLRRSPQLASDLATRGAPFAADQLTPDASFAAIDRFVLAIMAGDRCPQPSPLETLQPEGIV